MFYLDYHQNYGVSEKCSVCSYQKKVKHYYHNISKQEGLTKSAISNIINNRKQENHKDIKKKISRFFEYNPNHTHKK